MASDSPTDRPPAGDPTPASESPANVSARRRRKPQPHHRPSNGVATESRSVLGELEQVLRLLIREEIDAHEARRATGEIATTDEADIEERAAARAAQLRRARSRKGGV